MLSGKILHIPEDCLFLLDNIAGNRRLLQRLGLAHTGRVFDNLTRLGTPLVYVYSSLWSHISRIGSQISGLRSERPVSVEFHLHLDIIFIRRCVVVTAGRDTVELGE